MKLYYLTLLVVPLLASKNLDCEHGNSYHIQRKCDPSEYKEYISCVNRRQKRDACCDDDDDCSSGCDDCDCQRCSHGGCNDNCNNCCGTVAHSCQTHYCCYRTCHAQCSTSSCRRSCRKSCKETVDRHTSSQQLSSNSTAEIKTILNVFNHINNTNEIKIPVDVNTTSYNNITVLSSQLGNTAFESYYPPPYNIPMPGYPQIPPQQPEIPQAVPPIQPIPQIPIPQIPIPQIPIPQIPSSCCEVATPRQCVPQATHPYVSCYYKVQHVCSNICQAHPVVYPQYQSTCDKGISTSCQSQVVYSSQPRTICAFAPNWPYFGCGKPHYGCSGCYESQFDVSQCPDYCNGGYGYY